MPSLNDTLGARLFQVPDLDALSKIGPLLRQNRDLIYVADQGALYEFNATSTDGASTWVVVPYDGNGRFVRTEPRVKTALDNASTAQGAADTAQAAADTAQAAADTAQVTAEAITPVYLAGRNFTGPRTIANLNTYATTAPLGLSAVLTDAGTPAASGSATFAIGDIAEWTGAHWALSVENVDGVPQMGTKLSCVTSGFGVTNPDEIATFDGLSTTPTYAPASGTYPLTVVINTSSVDVGVTSRIVGALGWLRLGGPAAGQLYLNPKHIALPAPAADNLTASGTFASTWTPWTTGARPTAGTYAEVEALVLLGNLRTGGGTAVFALTFGSFTLTTLASLTGTPTPPIYIYLRGRVLVHTAPAGDGSASNLLMIGDANAFSASGTAATPTALRPQGGLSYNFSSVASAFTVTMVAAGGSGGTTSANLMQLTGRLVTLPVGTV